MKGIEMTGEKEPDDFTNHFMWDTDNSRRANEATIREIKRRHVRRASLVIHVDPSDSSVCSVFLTEKPT